MRMRIVARNRAVAIEGDRIVRDDGPFDLVLSCPDADVRPGLINAHDHLHRNHYGRLGKPPYRHAVQWAHDIQARYRRRIAKGQEKPRRAALLDGAWKNLFCGVTSVVHHDRWEADFDRHFPLRVPRIANADSLGMTPALDTIERGRPYCLHVAEGVDDDAATEIRRLAALGWLTRDLIAVHGVGMDETATRLFRAAGAALVWCPSSNLFLFGRTASEALVREGMDLLIGTDSRLTGAGDLLDELRTARRLGIVGDERLENAVGTVAARRLGLAPPSLEPGATADLLLLTRPLLEATAGDVSLVIVGGTPRVARPDLAASLRAAFGEGEIRTIGPVARWTQPCSSPIPDRRSPT